MYEEPTIIDLFSGCGGFSLGAHLAGFRTALAVDVDPILSSSYQLNFPHAPHFLADLGTVDLRRAAGEASACRRFDGVIGGPPCQGFSEIGPRAHNDPRNELVWHFFRHVAAFRPSFFVMENVRGLWHVDKRRVLEAALEQVASKYTILGPVLVDASGHGAPTRRTRLIVIGYDPRQADAPQLLEGTTHSRVTVRDAIGDLTGAALVSECDHGFDWWSYGKAAPPSPYANACREIPTNGVGASWAIEKLRQREVSGMRRTRHSEEVESRFAQVPPGELDRVGRHPRLAWDGLCTALRAGTGFDKGRYQSVRPLHPEENRVITAREAARLQGFPDWFQFHPTTWHSFRMIGNSVAPPLALSIMRAMFDSCTGGDRFGVASAHESHRGRRVDRLTPTARSALMRAVKPKNTSPERRVRQLAHSLGYRFRLHRTDLPGTPDLVFPSRRKVIFVNGCFWHRHPNCRKATMPKSRLEYWKPKFDRNVERDLERARKLRELGWEVAVIWECETRDPIALIELLQNFLGPPSQS